MPVYDNAIFIEVEIDGQTYPIAIDAFDLTDVNADCVSQVAVYLKMQYAKQGYPYKNIVPGGFIPAYSTAYLYLDKARKIRDSQTFLYDAYGRFGGRFAKSIRGSAVEKLSSQSDFSYHGGIGRVRYYLSHPQERETIARGARQYFDQHLSRPKLAAYYINALLGRISS